MYLYFYLLLALLSSTPIQTLIKLDAIFHWYLRIMSTFNTHQVELLWLYTIHFYIYKYTPLCFYLVLFIVSTKISRD